MLNNDENFSDNQTRSCFQNIYTSYLRPQYNNRQQQAGYVALGVFMCTLSSVIIFAVVTTENKEQAKLKAISALLGLTALEALIGCWCCRLGRQPIYEAVAGDEESLARGEDSDSNVSYVFLNK